MFQHIIAAVDGSAHSSSALLHAGQLALANQAQLTLVHISNLQDLSRMEIESSAMPQMLERTLCRGRDLLESAQQQLQQQLPAVTCHCHLGESWLGKRDMANLLVKFALAHDADLIVLGSHGRSGLLNLLMGSFIENLLRITPCPLLVIRQANAPLKPAAVAAEHR